MFVRWNERARPRRQIACGGCPVMSRPAEAHAPRVRDQVSRDDVEQRGLARAVGPDHRRDLPGLHAQRHPAQGLEAAEGPRDVRDLEQRRRRHRRASIVEASDDVVRRRRRPALDEAHDSAGEDVDQRQQDDAEHDRPVLGERRHHRVEHDQDSRPQRRAEEDVRTAEERHEQDLRRLRPERIVGEGPTAEEREERPGEAGHSARDDEGQELHALDVDAHELRALGVLPDREQGPAERRIDEAPEGPGRQPRAGEGEEIEGPRPGERFRHRDRDQAVVAAGQAVPLVRDRPDDLRKRQREHREVDAREPDAEQAEDEGGGGRQDRRGEKGHGERGAGLLQEEPAGVGAEAVERGMPERDHPRVAQEQIEGHREESHDQDLGRQQQIEVREHQRDQHEHGGQQQAQRRRIPAHWPAQRARGLPRSPHGRVTSTTTIST